MYKLSEIEKFNDLVDGATSPTGVKAVLEQLIEWKLENRFYWQNDDLSSFFEGMISAIDSLTYTPDNPESFADVEDSRWHTVAQVISMALVMD